MIRFRSAAVAVVLLSVLFAGCQAVGRDGYGRKRLPPPPPDLDLLQVTQLPPLEPAPPRTPPFDDTITATTVAGATVTVRFHADTRTLVADAYPQSDPVAIRGMIALAREFGTNAAGRYLPLEINHVAQHPFRPSSYSSSHRTAVVITPRSIRQDAATNNRQGNVVEVAVYDDPWTAVADSDPSQIWTAYGHLILDRITEDNNGVHHRRIKCLFLRQDSKGVQIPMSSDRLVPRLSGALSSGYVRFDTAVAAQGTTDEDVRIFTEATDW